MGENNSVSDQNSSLTSTTNQANVLMQILNEIKSVKQDTAKFNDRQESLENFLNKFASDCENRLMILEVENSELKRKLSFLETENELLYRSTNFQNLIFTGIPDEENESSGQLQLKVMKIITQKTGKQIKFDSAYRIGASAKSSQRAVRVHFFCHQDRNSVYEKRREDPTDQYINEDLPFSVRRNNRAIRLKKAELTDEGIKFNIDWKAKKIHLEDGDVISVHEGKYLHKKKNNGESSIPELPPPPLKKSKPNDSNDDLLGRINTRRAGGKHPKDPNSKINKKK